MLSFLIFLVISNRKTKRTQKIISNTSDFFLPLLPLFILPSCIGIIEHFTLVKTDALKIIIALFIGMILTQTVTPILFLWAQKKFTPADNTNSPYHD